MFSTLLFFSSVVVAATSHGGDMLFKKNNCNDRFLLASEEQRYCFSRKELAERCAFFETFFASLFCSTSDDRKLMALSKRTSDLIDIKYLFLVVRLLRRPTKDAARRRIRVEASVMRRVGLFPPHRGGRGSRKLRAWTLSASCDQLYEMLKVCDYFQVSDLVKHFGFNIDRIEESDLKLATKLLPFADQCGNPTLFEAALKVASTAFVRTKRILADEGDPTVRAELTSTLLKERFKKTRVCGIFRVDTALDDRENFCNFYVIVAFGPDVEGGGGGGGGAKAGEQRCWKPRIVDQFCLDNNERVTKALTLYGYIYVLTTQFLASKNQTKIRLRQFNPYSVISASEQKIRNSTCLQLVNQKAANKSSSSSSSPPKAETSTTRPFRILDKKAGQTKFGRGWVKEPCTLVKPGLVDHIHAEVHCTDEMDLICLRYWSRPTRMKAGRKSLVVSPQPLADADRYNVVKKKWSLCRNCQQLRKKFKGPDTMSQILNLGEDGEVRTTVRKSYQQYATEQEYVKSTNCFLLKSVKVIYPPLPGTDEGRSEANQNKGKRRQSNTGGQASSVIERADDDDHRGEDVHIGIFYRILVDRSNSKGSSRFQLTQYKLGKPSQHRVLYTLSNDTANDTKALSIREDVEHILRHSNLAIPEILNLSFPRERF